MSFFAMASFAHADLSNTTFRINRSDVEMITTNTSDSTITVVSVKLLGSEKVGKPSPVLFELSPSAVINARQQKAILIGKVADIRRSSPSAS